MKIPPNPFYKKDADAGTGTDTGTLAGRASDGAATVSASPVESPLEPGFDEQDEQRRPPPQETDFDRIVSKRLSRRGLLEGAGSAGLYGFLVAAGLPAAARARAVADDGFGFAAIDAQTDDTIHLPPGFEWQVVVKWGDPLWSHGGPLDEATGGSALSQQLAFGDNNDGMSFISHEGRQLLIVNNEYINKRTLFPAEGHKPQNKDDFQKSIAAHGVSVLEVQEEDGRWLVVKDSPYNRRVTGETPMTLTGPAAGHSDLQTEHDPGGYEVLGTFNNCGNGMTPWGTYLSCEENFNGYFASSDAALALNDVQKRYGISHKDYGYDWALFDERFDIAKTPNEANRFGYVVEFDPRQPRSPLKKRTKLGRFKHENAEVVLAKDGRVVVYMGDDERGEFLYKFVSREVYRAGGPTDNLLNKGTLYVAKFYEDGAGAFLPLTPETTGMSEAEICIYTRLAASKVGATTMDRPEWVAAHPVRAEVYCALTNNKHRGIKTNKGGDPMPVGGPNPRAENLYGQIVSWQPDKGDHAETGFQWQLFAVAGNPHVHEGERAGSANIKPGNLFNAPDGLMFDKKGRLWIQTDGDYSNKGDFAGMGNNQMLVGDTQSGEIRRFLVGPRECEVTGLCWSGDGATLFVGIQHPGGGGGGHFPLGGDHLPRSCVIAVRRKDSQPI